MRVGVRVTQAVAPAFGAEPEAQEVHGPLPAAVLTRPSAHLTHTAEVDFETLETTAPLVWPAGQRTDASHFVAPGRLNVPAAHVTQSLLLVAPVVLEKVFAGHCAHASFPGKGLYVPATQDVQPAAPSAENVPAVHDRQLPLDILPLSLLYLPAAHVTHEVLPVEAWYLPAAQLTHEEPEMNLPAGQAEEPQSLADDWPTLVVVLPIGQLAQLYASV